MKNLLILLTCLTRCALAHAAEVSVLPEATILAPSWDVYWWQQLVAADTLYHEKEDLLAAAAAYKELSNNRQYPNEQVRALATKSYREILENPAYIQARYLQDQKHNTEAAVLRQRLEAADAEPDRNKARALYTELSNAPYPHYWMQSWAAKRLQETQAADSKM